MQRKKTPEEIRKRELLKELIQLTGTKTASQAQDLVKEILSGTLETMLNSELEEELGYSKYDYKN
ncbi:MAG: IS256 family transposase, partial [Clostridiales bacterium]|nr:IS256 family transposase [Clostridiales bacterium]